MKLSELIARYGDEHIQFQNLDQCTERLDMNRGVTKITFGTEQPIDMNGTQRLGIVVWMDRADVGKIIADIKAAGGDS
jgi:hypothetical protein